MVARGKRRVGPDPTGEQPREERLVHDHPAPPLPAQREEPILDVPVEKVIGHLVCDRWAGLKPVREVILPEVGHPDVADLARAHESLQRPGGLLERGLWVGEVKLVEVDPVCSQAAQAFLGGPGDRLRAGIVNRPP